MDINYRKVASSRLSQLVAHFWIFRLFMKEKFYAFGPKSLKLNSRPVYCSRLYSNTKVKLNFVESQMGMPLDFIALPSSFQDLLGHPGNFFNGKHQCVLVSSE